jgi:hypothetical protein
MADVLPPNVIFGSDGISIPAEIEIKNLSGTVADLNVLEQSLNEASEQMRIISQMTASVSENFSTTAENSGHTTEAVQEQLDAMTQLADITERVSGYHKDIVDAVETVAIIKLQQIDRERELLALTQERAEAEIGAALAAEEGESIKSGGSGQIGRVAQSLGKYYKGQASSKIASHIPRSGLMGQVSGGLKQLGTMGGEGGLISSGAASTAAGAAAGLGVLYAGYEGYSKLANTQNEYSKLTGGSSMMESQGYEMKARMMAIDPLLSTGQSRQIIQEALRQGFGGDKQFDNVTEFMADNMKKFGMSAKASVDLYKTAIIEADGSIGELNGSMDSLRASAKEGGQGLEAMMSAFTASVGTLAGQGAGGATTSAAQYITQAYSGYKTLEGINLTSATSNVGFGNLLAQNLGTNFTNLYSTMSGLGESPTGGAQLATAYQTTLKQILGRMGLTAGMTKEQIGEKAYMLTQMLQQFGISVSSPEQAVELAYATLSGGIVTPEAQQSKDVERLLTEGGGGGGGGNYMSAIGNAAKSMFGNAESRTESRIKERYFENRAVGNMPKLPLVEALLNSSYNMRDFSVIDENGKKIELRDYLSVDAPDSHFLAIQRGEVKLIGEGGGKEEEDFGQGATAAEIISPSAAAYQNAGGPRPGTAGYVGYAGGSGSSSTPTTNVQIQLSPDAARLLTINSDSIIGTTNNFNADRGYSNRNESTNWVGTSGTAGW